VAAYFEDADEDEEEDESMFHEDGPITKGSSMACSSAVRTGFSRLARVHDDSAWQHNAATWPQDSYWRQQSGVNVRTGCPANCEVCRFGGHL